jgi:phage-related protein
MIKQSQNTGRPPDKPLIILSGEIKSPPFSEEARIEAGMLLRRLQQGDVLSMPHARPMPSIGPRCLELRVLDKNVSWRIFCRVDADAVLVAHVMAKKTEATPKSIIKLCKDRLALYDSI